jgi:hypothetical protein
VLKGACNTLGGGGTGNWYKMLGGSSWWGDHCGVLLTVQFFLVFLVYAMAVQLDSSDGVTGHFFIRRLGGPQSGP